MCSAPGFLVDRRARMCSVNPLRRLFKADTVISPRPYFRLARDYYRAITGGPGITGSIRALACAIMQGRAGARLEGAKARRTEDVLAIVLISLLTLVTFLGLFALRSWDDNRLTSWQWTVAHVDLFKIMILLVLGMMLAYALSRRSFAVRQPAPLLFSVAFIAASFFWPAPEVIVDTARYFTQAKHLELYGTGYFLQEWGGEITAWTDLPLVPFLYGLVFSWFGEVRIGIQMLTTLLFSGTVVLTYMIGRTLWDETVGIYAGVLLLGMPYLFTQVPLMLVDVPTMFFLTLAVFATIAAIKSGEIRLLLLSSGAITLAMLSKFSAWLMLTIIPVIVLCHLNLGWRTILRRAGIIALGTAALFAMILLWKFTVIAEQLAFLQSYQLPGLKRWEEGLVSTFFFQIHPYITIAAMFSLYVAVKKRDWKYAIISWMLLLVVVLDIKRSRYVLVAFPMLALMAAYGLREIRQPEIRRYIASCAVISALVIALFAYLPFLQQTSAANLKAAGEYLDSIAAQRVEVITLPQARTSVNPAVAVPILDLFTRKTINSSNGQIAPPPPEVIARSPLRFTWEYKHPRYVDAGDGAMGADTAIALIMSDANQVLPEEVAHRLAGYRRSGYRLSKQLMEAHKVFKYTTIIKVYEPL